MFDENEAVTRAVDALVTICKQKSRGEIVTHEEIRVATDCEPYQGIWPQCVRRMKDRVQTELGVTLWSERCIGYRLCTLEEQFGSAPRKRIKFGMRQIKRGLGHVEAIVPGKIPHHLQVRRAFLREQLRQHRSKLHGELIRQAIFAKKNAPAVRIPFGQRPG